MSERPKANLVRTIEYGKSTTYIFSCVDCGKEFVRSANNRRINPYCGDCQRRYDKIKNAENKAKRQAEHDKRIRADAIDEFAEKCEKWIEKVNDIRCDNSAMLTIANIRELAEKLKEQKND